MGLHIHNLFLNMYIGFSLISLGRNTPTLCGDNELFIAHLGLRGILLECFRSGWRVGGIWSVLPNFLETFTFVETLFYSVLWRFCLLENVKFTVFGHKSL